jgi:phosphate/sulfate permease
VRGSNVEVETLKEANYMGLGVSIFLIAVGAILAWAVSVDTNGIDLNMVGVILMIVGILGLLLSLIFWSTWGGFGGWPRETVYREGSDPYYDRRPMP